jgi:hypothetical protein
VTLLSSPFVKPSVKGNKKESRDAEAICAAGSRPHLRFVPLKTLESHEIPASPRLRSRLLKERTALVNGDHEVRAPRVSAAFLAPVLRHSPFAVWVVLRRACAESIRAGKSSYFPRKPHICPPLRPLLSSLIIPLQRGAVDIGHKCDSNDLLCTICCIFDHSIFRYLVCLRKFATEPSRIVSPPRGLDRRYKSVASWEQDAKSRAPSNFALHYY